jgi:electron transfer DM13
MAVAQHAAMASIGDLGNDLAHAIYEGRVAVAIGSAVVIAVAVTVARRFGWFAAARHHPRRTAMLAAAVLAVTAPIGWYLGSPIFIRTSLVEAERALVAASPGGEVDSQLGSPAQSRAPSVAASAAPAAPPPPSPTGMSTTLEPVILAVGSFRGSDDFHFGRGTASIVQLGRGRYRLRLEQFSVRNGPDLFVYLSRTADGSATGGLELGRLKATDGSFGYDLPAGADPDDFASAIIWCKQFSHLFAVAPFRDHENG